jgi:dienelactone hydrolase
MRRLASNFILACIFPTFACADVVTVRVEYKQGDTKLSGWLAYDDSVKEVRPGVIVFPEWWGMTDYPKMRATQLAKLGYVALAADMYGDGKTTDDATEAGKLSSAVYADPKMEVARATAALDQLKTSPKVDASRIAAIGYCFGGKVALDLARGGANLTAIVSFHGNLATDHPENASNIKGKVMVCTGAEDSFVPPAQVAGFEDEMRKAKVDWQVISYGGAHHAFTNPDADRHKIDNISYNAAADRRSWEAMKSLFTEAFAGK